MNLKYEITKEILEILKLPSDEKRIKKSIIAWWSNPRTKQKGGLRLTPAGFEAFQKAKIRLFEVKLETPIVYTNEMILWLDNQIHCPFFLEKNKIFIFGEKMAVQLVLFSGNINLLKKAQENFLEKEKIDI